MDNLTRMRKTRPLSGVGDGEILVKVNPMQASIINALLETGLWGNTANQVTMRLLDLALMKESKKLKPNFLQKAFSPEKNQGQASGQA